MIEFLDAGLTREDQCGRVDAKPTGYCASSVVPFGKTAGFLFAWWSAGAGSRYPVYPTSMGRVLLAFHQTSAIDAYFERASLRKLTERKLHHACRQQVGTGFWQVFFFDPNGARIELDFAADEKPE